MLALAHEFFLAELPETFRATFRAIEYRYILHLFVLHSVEWIQVVVAFKRAQADEPVIPAACEEAPQARATGESRTKLRGASEGGKDLRLAGKLPAALGAPRASPFDLPGLFTGRSYPRVSEATLTCPKELGDSRPG